MCSIKEVWKPIKGFPYYEVSNVGRVRSLTRNIVHSNGMLQYCAGKLLTAGDNGRGYLQVGLCLKGKRYTKKVHRLVAETFIPNPTNKPEVNHIDEDKHNNYAGNLNWMTHEENLNHGTVTARISATMLNGSLSKPVIQESSTGEFIKEWPSAAEAGRNGFERSLINRCCRGICSTHKGFKWRFS